MSIFTKKYVTGCDTCQRMKNRPQQPYGPLQPNPVPEGPWDIITIDLITQLPESNGYNAICVVVDRLIKRAHFYAITNEFSAKDLAELLFARVWVLHGLPLQIISDRGVQFAASLFQEWCKLLGIASTMSTTYHPQTDGQTERVNQTLEQYLRCYVDYQLQNWSWLLSTAEFAYNNAAHEGTKESPFFLEYGRHPRAGPTITKEIDRTDLNDIMRNRQQAQEQAKAALKLAAERMKWYYDQGVQKVPFKVGDQVLLDLRDYQLTGRKLHQRYDGPFEIVEKLSPVTFRLKWPRRLTRIHPVFHASKLIPYHEAEIPGQKGPGPQPVTVDQHEEWEVEKILSSRRFRRKLQYLIRWKNCGPEMDSWEPAEHLANAPKLIAEYHDTYPEAINLAQSTPALITRDSTLQVQLDGGRIPTRGSDEAAGLDLYASQTLTIPPQKRMLVSTCIKIKLPSGTYGRIAPRSGLSLKGIDVAAGVIDRDYTGEIKVMLANNGTNDFTVNSDDRIAQLIVERIAIVDVEKVEKLDTTHRGAQGFGSTGS